MRTNTVLLIALSIAAAIAPASARAQDIRSTPGLTRQPALSYLPYASSSQLAGPRNAAVGVRGSRPIAPAIIPAETRLAGEGVGKTRAMMGVGVAAIVIGVIVGGDIGTVFVVGGGIIGLTGLYRFMK